MAKLLRIIRFPWVKVWLEGFAKIYISQQRDYDDDMLHLGRKKKVVGENIEIYFSISHGFSMAVLPFSRFQGCPQGFPGEIVERIRV